MTYSYSKIYNTFPLQTCFPKFQKRLEQAVISSRPYTFKTHRTDLNVQLTRIFSKEKGCMQNQLALP